MTLIKRTGWFSFYCLILFSLGNSSFGVPHQQTVINELHNSNTGSIRDTGYFRIIKINPFQPLFCEVPVSFETGKKFKRSTQFQLGFIFPLGAESELRRSLLSIRYNSTDSNAENYSYRRSPFYSHGLSFKIEFRKYGRYFYRAPQLMYKYSYYKEATFDVHGGGVTLNQTESKFSNIFGLGFIIGRQSYNGKLVTDWYGGVGLRLREMSVKIMKIENPAYLPGTSYPNFEQNFSSVYPFINFGLRVGIKL